MTQKVKLNTMTNKMRSVEYFTKFTTEFAIAAHFYGQSAQRIQQ